MKHLVNQQVFSTLSVIRYYTIAYTLFVIPMPQRISLNWLQKLGICHKRNIKYSTFKPLPQENCDTENTYVISS